MEKEIQEIMERKEGIVRLVGTDQKYHTAPVFIAPKYDAVMHQFIVGGKVYNTKEGKDKNDQEIFITTDAPVRFSDVDSFRFSHLQSFDMSKDQDRFMLQIALDDEMIAPNKKAVNNGVHRYYVEDKEKEAADKVSKNQQVFQAMEKLRSMSLEQMQDYGRLFGIFTKDISRSQLEAQLYDMAMDKPSKILEVTNDNNAKYKIFLRKLVSAGILRVTNGKYMNGNELVGVNEDYAIEYLRDTQNSVLVSQWNKMLKGEKAGTKAE